MKPQADSLILELTRRCNMCCEHCLRGDAENENMTLEVAIRAIDSFSSINSITFSGGEPTLCEDVFDKIVTHIIENDVNVYGFYVASNGKKVSMPFMCSLAKLYAHICRKNRGYMDDYQCTFDISRDQFHEDISMENKSILKAFTFTSERGEISDFGILNEGRARDAGIGYRNQDYNKPFEPEEELYSGDTCNRYEMVYVNVFGNIYSDCDWSYDTQDNILPHANLTEGDFDTIANIYNTKLEQIEF